MRPGNWDQYRYTFSNLAQGASPFYYPTTTGISGDKFDNIAVRAYLVAGAGDTVTLTVWSDTGAGLWLWDETKGGYNFVTGAYGTVSIAAAAGTATGRLLYVNHNAKLWRARVAVTNAGNPDNSGIVEFVRFKV